MPMGLVKDIIKNKYLYLLGLPGFTFLLVFGYVPMFGHLLAFQNFRLSKGIFGSDFVGFKNFEFFFGSNDWWVVTLNTLFLNSLFLVFGMVMAIALAIAINEITHKGLRRILQSAVFFPYFISWLVVSLLVLATLSSDGLMNQALAFFGLPTVSWFTKAEYWPAILTVIYVWKFAGYHSIIYLAAIVGISPEYYESARMDGASRWRQMTSITLPLITPVIIILTMMGIGRIFFGDFGMIYGIIGDNPMLYQTTDVIDTYTFRSLRQLGNFSMSSAIVLYQSLLGLILVVFSNSIVKKIDRESGLF